jgi:hypothetical protein
MLARIHDLPGGGGQGSAAQQTACEAERRRAWAQPVAAGISVGPQQTRPRPAVPGGGVMLRVETVTHAPTP